MCSVRNRSKVIKSAPSQPKVLLSACFRSQLLVLVLQQASEATFGSCNSKKHNENVDNETQRFQSAHQNDPTTVFAVVLTLNTSEKVSKTSIRPKISPKSLSEMLRHNRYRVSPTFRNSARAQAAAMKAQVSPVDVRR